ncbi:4-hydroxythreonine-4-phosphate dehydrogenase PdxA [Ramlibacter solisilvae]|uniref:4-hydroxythreonine-4-phosphate dehydrogenase n=1 Tax=Ramlibacter tataouinensis TaxID=94132 RepID=A0A127K078_9BURK|nr:4-hydroxythreonine-4-phosphate dehydrogenase PdxA [Ramlibacter tataouinensis]AMO23812.1 4-hydroxythreonine-4-phosphate dehydrogenase [Ramlibacter tataouinensis]
MRPFAITMGDAAGIGPEIIAKAFRDAPELARGCFVAGDVQAIRRGAGAVRHPGQAALPVAVIESPGEAWGMPPRCVPVLEVGKLARLPDWGRVSPGAGAAAADCVVWAARAALRGDIAGVVTAPLHKEALAAAAVNFPGHTELLQAQAAAWLGQPLDQVPVRMMLASDELRTVLVSIHVSMREAIEAVTFDNVLQTLRITHDSLSRLLGRAPHIGVAGLNPHAGEAGLFGREEIEVIAPAVAAAQAQGIAASGPFAPDTVFMRARARSDGAGEFDVVVAMYHDQGLIPVKYLGLGQGVNVTLGLPFVRTSPDHGTAFDLAGSGRANASSLVEAIRVAKSLAGVATAAP